MKSSQQLPPGRVLLVLSLLMFFSPGTNAEALDAEQIVSQAIEAAGGDEWRYAKSIRLTGHAMLHRGGNVVGFEADEYEMLRVYPTALGDADTATGKFRLDARNNGRTIFQTSFDGEYLYDRRGRVADDEAATRAASAFGFSAIRFALSEGFKTTRLVDDQIEGYPSYFVKVTDPSGGDTLFAFDQKDFSIRLVAWDTPQGWHERIYSDFYWVDDPGFKQPGRVRLYYDGVKSVDIRWTRAEVNVPIAAERFRIGPEAAESGAPDS